MPNPYDMALRERAVAAFESGDASYAQLAELFDVDPRDHDFEQQVRVVVEKHRATAAVVEQTKEALVEFYGVYHRAYQRAKEFGRRPRHSRHKRAFLREFANCGNVLRSARASGVGAPPLAGRWTVALQALTEADELMMPPAGLLHAGGEVAVPVGTDEVLTPDRNAIFSTLENPNMISVEASEHRMEAALGAGVLQAAVDAAVTAKAENSLEKMLCHQFKERL